MDLKRAGIRSPDPNGCTRYQVGTDNRPVFRATARATEGFTKS
jgi:hypothetical protein